MLRLHLKVSRGVGLSMIALSAAVALAVAAWLPFDRKEATFLELPDGRRAAGEAQIVVVDAWDAYFPRADADGAVTAESSAIAAVQMYFMLAAVAAVVAVVAWPRGGTWRGQIWMAVGSTFFVGIAGVEIANAALVPLGSTTGRTAGGVFFGAIWAATAAALLGGIIPTSTHRHPRARISVTVTVTVTGGWTAAAVGFASVGAVSAAAISAVFAVLATVAIITNANANGSVFRRKMVAGVVSGAGGVFVVAMWATIGWEIAQSFAAVGRWLHLKLALGTLGACALIAVGGWDALLAWADPPPRPTIPVASATATSGAETTK